jgi:hypothetical protein
LPFLRMGTNAALRRMARTGPSRNPRASRPTTTSTDAWAARIRAINALISASSASGSRNTGKTGPRRRRYYIIARGRAALPSWKSTPWMGKCGVWVTSAAMRARPASVMAAARGGFYGRAGGNGGDGRARVGRGRGSRRMPHPPFDLINLLKEAQFEPKYGCGEACAVGCCGALSASAAAAGCWGRPPR